MTYTLGIAIFYYIPFIFLFLYTVNKFLSKKIKYKNIWLIVSLLSCMPILIYLNYMGYVDIGGLNIIIILWLLTIRKKQSRLNYILIGTTLMVLYFFRRWYMFYVVTFLIVIFLVDFIVFIKSKDKKQEFKKYFEKYLIIGGTMLIIVGITFLLTIILFKNNSNYNFNWNNFYVVKLLGTDYGDIYSAYNKTLKNDLINLGRKFGYIIILLTLISTIISIKNKRNRTITISLFVQMILTFVLFKMTQSPEVHHMLLFTANIMLLIGLIFANSNINWIKSIVATILAINIICSIPITYNNNIVKFMKDKLLINSNSLKPLVREDINEFIAINNRIKELSEKGKKKIYLNSSSRVLNQSMVASYDKTVGISFESKKYLLQISNVDKRDGVPKNLKNADIVIVTSPDQIHLKAEEQEIITYINEIFLKDKEENILAKKYDFKEELKIDDVKLYVFEKNEKISEDDYEKFKEEAEEYIFN